MSISPDRSNLDPLNDIPDVQPTFIKVSFGDDKTNSNGVKRGFLRIGNMKYYQATDITGRPGTKGKMLDAAGLAALNPRQRKQLVAVWQELANNAHENFPSGAETITATISRNPKWKAVDLTTITKRQSDKVPQGTIINQKTVQRIIDLIDGNVGQSAFPRSRASSSADGMRPHQGSSKLRSHSQPKATGTFARLNMQGSSSPAKPPKPLSGKRVSLGAPKSPKSPLLSRHSGMLMSDHAHDLDLSSHRRKSEDSINPGGERPPSPAAAAAAEAAAEPAADSQRDSYSISPGNAPAGQVSPPESRKVSVSSGEAIHEPVAPEEVEILVDKEPAAAAAAQAQPAQAETPRTARLKNEMNEHLKEINVCISKLNKELSDADLDKICKEIVSHGDKFLQNQKALTKTAQAAIPNFSVETESVITNARLLTECLNKRNMFRRQSLIKNNRLSIYSQPPQQVKKGNQKQMTQNLNLHKTKEKYDQLRSKITALEFNAIKYRDEIKKNLNKAS